jgi:hypothetical protein
VAEVVDLLQVSVNGAELHQELNLLERDALGVLNLYADHFRADQVLQDKVESVGDSLGKCLVFEDLLAPLTELEHDPYALTCQLEVSATY